MIGYLQLHPHVLWLVLAALAVTIGWLLHWYVLDARHWLRTARTALGNALVAFDVARRRAPVFGEDWQREPETDADADELIAEWHTDPPGPDPSMPAPWAGGLHLETWHERMWWDDPDLTVWDARQAALRCWEILHVEFPRLRAELGCPA